MLFNLEPLHYILILPLGAMIDWFNFYRTKSRETFFSARHLFIKTRPTLTWELNNLKLSIKSKFFGKRNKTKCKSINFNTTSETAIFFKVKAFHQVSWIGFLQIVSKQIQKNVQEKKFFYHPVDDAQSLEFHKFT